MQRVANKVNGEWFSCGLAFSPLQIGTSLDVHGNFTQSLLTILDEDLDMDAEQVSSAKERLGTMRITITRGHNEEKDASKKRETQKKHSGHATADTTSLSKAVVVDKRVSHAVK